jgi:N-acetyl-1-D-myo-inositol-2-amino-2-deoxy-alpha-D-glucopyranoside deacetylase/mycothiol S-conjugate amidase
LRPQVVVTFDPVGGYRHPDHIAIHQATVKAFYAAGDPASYPGEDPPYHPLKLYYHTFPRRWLSWAVHLMPLFGQDPGHFGLNGDIDLLVLAKDSFPVHARVDYRAVQSIKKKPACHASQSSMGTSSLSPVGFSPGNRCRSFCALTAGTRSARSASVRW